MNDATAKAFFAVVEHRVLTFRNRALGFVKIDMHGLVARDTNANGLVGLAIAEFCVADKFFDFRHFRNPVKFVYFAGLGV